MPNVITRYRKDAGLTEADLANRAEVTRDYIVKLEQTMYTTPSGKVLEVLADLCYTTEEDIETEYLFEYAEKLREPVKKIELDWPIIHDNWKQRMVMSDVHPHTALREILAKEYGLRGSQVAWAKTFGIHQAVLNKFELGKTSRIPKAVALALGYCLMPPEFFQEFVKAVEDWTLDD